MTATFHHGEWATTRAGAVTLVQHASGWLIAHTDGERSGGESCSGHPALGLPGLPDHRQEFVNRDDRDAEASGLLCLAGCR